MAPGYPLRVAGCALRLPATGRRCRHANGPLLGPAHERELERRLEATERIEQVVGVADRLAAGGHDEVTSLDAGRLGQRPLFDATDQDAGTLREADGPSPAAGDQATCRRGKPMAMGSTRNPLPSSRQARWSE